MATVSAPNPTMTSASSRQRDCDGATTRTLSTGLRTASDLEFLVGTCSDSATIASYHRPRAPTAVRELVNLDRMDAGAPPASTPPARDRGAAWFVGSLALFVLLAVAHTWPLASAPRTWSRNDNADTVLHEWIMAWVSHQAVHDPIHLFDANIFHPERYTLAYSDPLIVESAMAAPLLWTGASPVLAYNIVLIAGFALTGWATSLVVARWTGSLLAGLVSGSLVAFNAFTLTRLPQIQFTQHAVADRIGWIFLDLFLSAKSCMHFEIR